MINYTVVSRHSVLSVEFRKYAVVNKTVVIMHKKKLSIATDISSVLYEKISVRMHSSLQSIRLQMAYSKVVHGFTKPFFAIKMSYAFTVQV